MPASKSLSYKSGYEGEINDKTCPGQEETDPKTGACMVMRPKRSLGGLAESTVISCGNFDTAL